MESIKEVAEFLGAVAPGVKIEGYGGQVMIVTRVTDKVIYGSSEYCLQKYGKHQEISLSIKTILNPHYRRDIKIIEK